MKITVKDSLNWWSKLNSIELKEIMKANFLPHVLPHKLSNKQIKNLYKKSNN